MNIKELSAAGLPVALAPLTEVGMLCHSYY